MRRGNGDGMKNLGRRAGPGRASRKPALHWQAISFGLIGLSGTVITFVLLTLLHKGLGWGIALANLPAYSAGIVNNYTWNRLWTYRHQENGKVLQQGLQFGAISLCGLVINTAVLAGSEHAGAPYLAAFAGATVVTFFWNFTANHNLTFRHNAAERLHGLGDAVHLLPHHADEHHLPPSTAEPPATGDETASTVVHD